MMDKINLKETVIDTASNLTTKTAVSGTIKTAIGTNIDDPTSLNSIKNSTIESDGLSFGIDGDDIQANIQKHEFSVTEGADGLTSSSSLTYGAYVESDGDIGVKATKLETREVDGGHLSYGIQGDVGTEGIAGKGAFERVWEGDGTSAFKQGSLDGGMDFSVPSNGGNADWAASIRGEVQYQGDMLSQFEAYAYGNVTIEADPSGIDHSAEIGLGKRLGEKAGSLSNSDLRVGINNDGAVSGGIEFKF